MAAWVLVPCLVRLRSELNAIAPGRDKSSDGSVGDAAHQGSQSDHNPDETGNVPIRDADRVNEVHAIDVDDDLRVPGLTMYMIVNFLVARCRSGAEKRLRYIIYDRVIWSASNGWAPMAYTGDNLHTEHAHFSASYTTAHEASTASWHLEEVVPVSASTPEENAAAAAVRDVDPSAGTQTWGGAAWTTLLRTGFLANQWAPAVSAEIDALQVRVDDVNDDLDAVGATLALMGSVIGQVTNEPGQNLWYAVARRAVADELDARNMMGTPVE